MKLILALFIGAILSMAPVLMASGNNVFAQNTAAQIIAQSQVAKQLGICISGDFTLISCNNLSDQDQTNFGNNAASQNDDDGDGNSALQAILQNQESDQDALCVSGDGTFLSCNNVNEQDQTNFGNNALLQNSEGDSDDGKSHYGWKGYDGYFGNTATQVISQNQESDQNSFVVSGDDTIASGNNFNDQEQTNFGNNAALQNNDDDDDGKSGGNTATQVISQNQESDQDSACVSGGDTAGSCNNFNSQSQTNYGNNALLQNR